MTVPRPPLTTPAGLSHATTTPDCDFETYSEAGFVWNGERWLPPEGVKDRKNAGLGAVGAANYSAHESFEILTFSYDLKDGLPKRRWLPHMPPPVDLFAYVATGGPLEAWNVGFERWVWEHYCTPRLGWPVVAPHQWRCAMAKARAHALPGSLDNAGKVLQLPVLKDDDGKRLIQLFSIPKDPSKHDPRKRIVPAWNEVDAVYNGALLAVHRLVGEPKAGERRRATIIRKADEDARTEAEDAARLLDYNETDIVVEAEASSRIPDLSPTELRYWQDDQEINRRGIQIDLESVENCIAVLNTALARFTEEFAELTGGGKPSEVAATIAWLHGRGVHMDALDEEAVTEALKTPGLDATTRRVLEIRAAAASASVKKVFALRNHATRQGRVHDLYAFHGARTGRPTSHGPQAANLPKAGPNVYRCVSCQAWHGSHTMACPWCGVFTMRGPKDAKEWNPDVVEYALRALATRSFDVVQSTFGDVLLTIAGVLRGLFISRLGYDLVSSDYTAIEGVVVACLAGEQWRVDAYANDSPMYLLSAERMFGVTVAEMQEYARVNGHHHELRQKGKGGELGLGFGGWINALRQFGVDGADADLTDTVLKWRAASPALVWFWGGQTQGVADECRSNAGMTPLGRDRYGRPSVDRWSRVPEMFGLEGAAVSAVQQPGQWFPVARLDGTDSRIAYYCRDDVLYCRVPSGGLITYHRPRLQRSDKEWRGLSLSFEGWNTNPKSGPPGWIRMNTYSGKLCENVVQKTARDIQMSGIAREHDAGYPIVMHTYDEVVAEVPEGFGSVPDLERLMTAIDPWAEGWPIKAAGGWRAKRYRKG